MRSKNKAQNEEIITNLKMYAYQLRALCRTCGVKIDENDINLATQLFEESNQSFISLIENITDIWIEYDNNLPELICESCKAVLDKITEWSERCVNTHTKLQEAKQNLIKNSVDKILPFEETESVDFKEFVDVDDNLQYEEETPEPQSSQVKVKKKNARKKYPKHLKKTWICEQCGGEFKCSTYLKLHLLRHTGKKEVECDICQAKYYTQNEMLRHRILHTDARPYSCKYCDKTFRGCSSRAVHERIHTNERPFACSYCEKRFTSTSTRRSHELVHTDKRQYHCQTCDQWFLRSAHLEMHQRSKQHKKKSQNAID
ncbi:transcription factor Ouib-like isoform X2 [Scaptodrosophila lebanonensis]|uniref:Transcription factor Ouib-like isoform X2 n=1 Tax=Drosophila lebanonensis TaxID=7225 RepID=A0A6J2TD12_DROLE|nr:transcription factor Ouib-like isoform X2 [Scaptodrosophila lebanonensis]